MERQWTKRILVSSLVLFTAGVAQAERNYSYNDYAVAADPQPSYEGIGRIADVSRKNGGALYRLDLAKAIPLTLVKAKAKTGKLKVISVNLVTEKNERIAIKALANVALADTAAAVPSEALNPAANIAAIEVTAEAMGGAAALDINAISNLEVPQLSLREEQACGKKFDAVLKEKLDIVQVWAGRAESSAVGSWQEKYASKEFTKYVNDFIATLKADKASFASTEYTLTLLNFFAERHNISRADSAAEAGYKAMATETFDVFLASFESDQSCRAMSSASLIDIAVDFQKRQEAAKPDSRGRKIYEMMIAKLGKFIPVQYRKELATKNLTFRQADTEGYKFYKMFATSKPESFLKDTYQDMSTNAYALAEQALIKEVKSLDNEQTYQLIVEYQGKYNDPANYPQEIMMKYLTILSEHSNFLNRQL